LGWPLGAWGESVGGSACPLVLFRARPQTAEDPAAASSTPRQVRWRAGAAVDRGSPRPRLLVRGGGGQGQQGSSSTRRHSSGAPQGREGASAMQQQGPGRQGSVVGADGAPCAPGRLRGAGSGRPGVRRHGTGKRGGKKRKVRDWCRFG